jgi:CheY-like chemotaxis protein
MMPEMDGVQTTAAIRGLQGPYYKNLPVIALTANVIAEQREMFLANDMSDFLAKPINMKELNKILRKWLPQDKQSKNMTAADAEERGNVSPNALRHLDIEGINVDTGFRQVNGIVSSYLSILSGFCYDMEDQTGQLLADLSREDVALFEIHVHAVKNAARSIGALTLSEFAMHMEELASKKNLAAIQQESGALIDDIRRLKKNIETALSRYADPGADADDAQEDISCLQFEPLKAALLDMDIATIDAITDQYLTMQLTPRLKKIVFEIEQNILLYEYEKAIEVIDQFM